MYTKTTKMIYLTLKQSNDIAKLNISSILKIGFDEILPTNYDFS